MVYLVVSLAKFSEIILRIYLSFCLLTLPNLSQWVEQGHLSTPKSNKLRLSVHMDAFNPPVCRYFSLEAPQKSDARRSASWIELDSHHGAVLWGDLKLEEVAAVNACSHKQLLFLVEVALVDKTGPHLNGINVNEIFVEEMKFEIRAYH